MFQSSAATKITINTGNVLNLIDVKKKAGQSVTEELSESIKLTLSEWSNKHNGLSLQNGTCTCTLDDQRYEETDFVVVSPSKATNKTYLTITRAQDDVETKMAEEERKDLKIGVKIFINEDSQDGLRECLESVFTALKINRIDNVILAYNPDLPSKEEKDNINVRNAHSTNAPTMSLGSSIGKMPATIDADNEADARKCEAILPGIKILWEVLEEYVREGRVGQLGVADIGAGCLRKLHSWARARPSIAQINLASCCVVPPQLHQFCKANDVQLLTHADPPDLLSEAALKTLPEAGKKCNTLDWCARYQVHIKCRGVLALKGYVCKATFVPDV